MKIEKTKLGELHVGDKFYLPSDRKKTVITVHSGPMWSPSGSALIECSDGKFRRKFTQVCKICK